MRQGATAPVGMSAPLILSAFAEGFQGQTGRVAITDLEAWHCRFPIDQPNPGPVKYCGLARHEASSYCAAHAARCGDPHRHHTTKRRAA